MPYTVPTRDQFTTRFPIFVDKSDEAIDAALLEASGQVDETWREQDYQIALMYLAAHLLATDNSEEGEEPQVGAAAGQVASESFGGMSISYASTSESNAANKSQWGTTEYGRRYYGYLTKNRYGPVVV